jgi:uncharacterized protein (TIGR02271 family)
MSSQKRVPFLGKQGLRGYVIASSSVLQGGGEKTIICDDGRQYRVPSSLLALNQDGTYRLDAGPQQLQRFAVAPIISGPGAQQVVERAPRRSPQRQDAGSDPGVSHAGGNRVRTLRGGPEKPVRTEEMVIPVIEEEAEISKRTRDTARVRVRRKVTHREVHVDEPFFQETFEVKRVPMNTFIDAAPSPRMDGDTMIVPVVEEVVTIEKRLMLREEVHIIRKREQLHTGQTITLRKEDVDVQRVEIPKEGEGDTNG